MVILGIQETKIHNMEPYQSLLKHFFGKRFFDSCPGAAPTRARRVPTWSRSLRSTPFFSELGKCTTEMGITAPLQGLPLLMRRRRRHRHHRILPFRHTARFNRRRRPHSLVPSLCTGNLQLRPCVPRSVTPCLPSCLASPRPPDESAAPPA